MKLVGDQLSKWALSNKSEVERDMFGRSAFNRYYYAAFLITREMLADLDSKWKKERHSSIPNLLTGSVKQKVKRSLDKSAQNGLITMAAREKLLASLRSSTTELSNMLLNAYSLRCVADYEPDELVTFEEKIIMLHSEKLTSAGKWDERARAYSKTIRRVWKEAGLG